MHTFDGVDLLAFLLALVLVASLLTSRTADRRARIQREHDRRLRILAELDFAGEQTYRNELAAEFARIERPADRDQIQDECLGALACIEGAIRSDQVQGHAVVQLAAAASALHRLNDHVRPGGANVISLHPGHSVKVPEQVV